MVEVLLTLGTFLVLAVVAAVGGGLVWLAAVWLHAHRSRRGLWARYAAWVDRKVEEIEAKAKKQATQYGGLVPTEDGPSSKLGHHGCDGDES